MAKYKQNGYIWTGEGGEVKWRNGGIRNVGGWERKVNDEVER